MRLFRDRPWYVKRHARQAHRMLNWLAPNVFGELQDPMAPPAEISSAVREMAMQGFRGDWPVVYAGRRSVALVPGLSSHVSDCWAVPGIDHRGQVSYLVFGVGEGAFHSLCATPSQAVAEARRLRPTVPQEHEQEPVALPEPSHA